jgi:sRNA-binding carbon storage regulator CsrA
MRAAGEMPEWPNGTDSKSVEQATVPRVRIPISPPLLKKPCNSMSYGAFSFLFYPITIQSCYQLATQIPATILLFLSIIQGHKPRKECAMLVLTRKEAQGIRFIIRPEYAHRLDDLMRDGITVTITEIKQRGQARVGIDAPDCVLVLRDELVLLD